MHVQCTLCSIEWKSNVYVISPKFKNVYQVEKLSKMSKFRTPKESTSCLFLRIHEISFGGNLKVPFFDYKNPCKAGYCLLIWVLIVYYLWCLNMVRNGCLRVKVGVSPSVDVLKWPAPQTVSAEDVQYTTLSRWRCSPVSSTRLTGLG